MRERLRIIEELRIMDTTYVPPPDYRPQKKQRRVYIPDPDNPSASYIGLLIGPGGQTQRDLEKETKTKISIRGKGAQNKNASRTYNSEEDADEPLFVLIQSEKEEDLDKAEAMVKALFEMDDGQRQGALVQRKHLNARFWCESCGQQGHRFYDCPEKLFSKEHQCGKCFSADHATQDCPQAKKMLKNG